MATLKEISMRLKSIRNIAKITKTMKMIASTRVAKAQRAMESARVYGTAASEIFKQAETSQDLGAKTHAIAVSSDRGLCGGVHSSISKATKRFLAANPNAAVSIIGLKARAQIVREYRKRVALTFDQVAKNGATWREAALVTDEVLGAKLDMDSTRIYYNEFKSVIAFETSSLPAFSLKAIEESPKLAAYEVEPPVLKSFEEFAFASTLYWTIAEGSASEVAARRTAMENATKNAGEMINKLQLTYNRSRQASITNDLIDIITGASAM